MKYFKQTIILFFIIGSAISPVTDESNCSFTASGTNCSTCLPYTHFISNDNKCYACSYSLPNCLYCSDNGCEQCADSFYLGYLEGTGYTYCISETELDKCDSIRSFYSRFGQSLNYCYIKVVSKLNDKPNTLMIVLLIVFSCILVIVVVVLIVIYVMKKMNKFDKIRPVYYKEHFHCSLCDIEKVEIKAKEKENFDNVNTLSCGGFICNLCRPKAQGCLATGKYYSCITCKKLVTWFVTPPLNQQIAEVNEQNQIHPKTEDRLVQNNISSNIIEISSQQQQDNCVVCMKPGPNAVIPCNNKPKHLLHKNCLGDFYKTYYITPSNIKLTCPICRAFVDV